MSRKRKKKHLVSLAVLDMRKRTKPWTGLYQKYDGSGLPLLTSQDHHELKVALSPAPNQRVWVNKHSYVRPGTLVIHTTLSKQVIITHNGQEVTHHHGGQGGGYLRNQIITVPGRLSGKLRNPASFPLAGCDRAQVSVSVAKTPVIRDAVHSTTELCDGPYGKVTKRTRKRNRGRVKIEHSVNVQEQSIRNAALADKYRGM